MELTTWITRIYRELQWKNGAGNSVAANWRSPVMLCLDSKSWERHSRPSAFRPRRMAQIVLLFQSPNFSFLLSQFLFYGVLTR